MNRDEPVLGVEGDGVVEPPTHAAVDHLVAPASLSVGQLGICPLEIVVLHPAKVGVSIGDGRIAGRVKGERWP